MREANQETMSLQHANDTSLGSEVAMSNHSKSIRTQGGHQEIQVVDEDIQETHKSEWETEEQQSIVDEEEAEIPPATF